MGRYQYELSHCNETSCCYEFSGGNPWRNCAYTPMEIRLCECSSLSGGWNKPTGFIRWNTSMVNGWNKVRNVCNLMACSDNFYWDDLRIVNDFPTDRIVIASMYGFMVREEIDQGNDCWQMMPIGQRQMFILPTGCRVCYCMKCNIENLNKMPDGSYIYGGRFPGGTTMAQYATAPYFASIESYPLPVLNSNGHMGDNGACQFVSPTAICSTGTADATIPVCTSGFIDCCPSCFIPLCAGDGRIAEGPALKGPLNAYNSLKGKLSADSNSSAKDAYVMVSACCWWAGETTVPDNVAMTIMNWSFPMGAALWAPNDSDYNQMSRAMHKIMYCMCDCTSDEGIYAPAYGPKAFYEMYEDYSYCLPGCYLIEPVCFNVPPKSDKLVTHITENMEVYPEFNNYGFICACSAFNGSCNTPWLCNPLGYWTYKWNNGNSYYAVNTHCT